MVTPVVPDPEQTEIIEPTPADPPPAQPVVGPSTTPAETAAAAALAEENKRLVTSLAASQQVVESYKKDAEEAKAAFTTVQETVTGLEATTREQETTILTHRKETVSAQKGIPVEQMAEWSLADVEKFAAALPDRKQIPQAGFDIKGQPGEDLTTLSAAEKIRAGIARGEVHHG